MISPARLVAILWGAWVLVWLFAAMFSARTVVRESSGSRLAYSVLIWGGALLSMHRFRDDTVLTRPWVPVTPGLAWSAVAIVFLGFAFTIWARVHLGRMWSGSVTLKEEHTIVRSGPYAITRHPIYTGLLLAVIGTTLLRGTPAGLLGFVLFTAGIVLKLQLEERLLTEHFGDAYRAYRSEVPALVPRLWPRGRSTA